MVALPMGVLAALSTTVPRTSPAGGGACCGPAGPDGAWALATPALARRRRPRTAFRVRRIGNTLRKLWVRREQNSPAPAWNILHYGRIVSRFQEMPRLRVFYKALSRPIQRRHSNVLRREIMHSCTPLMADA